MQDKVALCLGQNLYEYCERLQTPCNDSNAVADALRSVGFSVRVANNTTRKDLKAVIKQFHQSLTPGCIAIFYFSGYSVQQNDEKTGEPKNYCCPIDAAAATAADVDDECISVDWILSGMTECPGAYSVVILEAARGNPFEGNWKSFGAPYLHGLATMRPPDSKNVLVAFSAEPGSAVSYEYTLEGNAVFTSAFVNRITIPNLPIVELFTDARKAVLDATDGRQRTWVQTRGAMDLCCLYRRATSPLRSSSPPRSPLRSSSPTKGSYTSYSSTLVSSPRRSPERLRSKSPQRPLYPSVLGAAPWTFTTFPHPVIGWRDCLIDSSLTTATHPSVENCNAIVALGQSISSGYHALNLTFQRPPEETESAHSVELVPANAIYDNDCPALTFELPNVQLCEARFVIDFAADKMTMYTNDVPTPVALTISDLERVGGKPPYKLVCYLWDANSTVSIRECPWCCKHCRDDVF